MLGLEEQRRIVISLVAGIIVVIILAIAALIGVWKGRAQKIKELEEYKLGRIKYEAVSEEQYVKKYFTKIEEALMSENYDKLYEMLGKDYIEYAQITKESLKEYIESKKIARTQLTLTTYQSVSTNLFSNTYILSIKQKNGIYDASITIREISPNDFTIAFDDYIASEDTKYNNTINSLNIAITRVTYFSDYVEYDIRLKNVHDNTIVLNSNSDPEGIYLKLKGDKLVSPYSTVLGGRKIEIEKERIKEYTLRYMIKNENMTAIESLVIEDVYYEGANKTATLEFVI